jgi:DNA processing protein
VAKQRADTSDLFTPAPLPVAELDDAQRMACLRLIRSQNVGPITFRELINQYGGAHEALAALRELSGKSGRGKPIRICTLEAAEIELENARRHGAKPLFTIEPGYPPRLAYVDSPPPLIYAKGNMDLLRHPSLAIVGARQASAAGIKLARLFAQELGAGGLAIVSGLARGIDAAAHEASLQTGTIAVLAGGVDHVYPSENEALHARIAEVGCLVSEMPCGFQPRGQDFPRRNRLISGISLGVLVVEAARRSGTLSTARRAADQNREIFAIPGNPLDPRAEGTNLLLKSGATLVTEPADILQVLKPLTGLQKGEFREIDLVPADDTFEPIQPPPEPIAEERELVLSMLSPSPVSIDDIVRATGLDIRAVRTILIELDLEGMTERHGAQLVSLLPASD